MKSILMSIRPEWVCEILNGRKTIEIRRKFPKDYVGWIYIYVAKGKDLFFEYKRLLENEPHIRYLNGKVVARFWCDEFFGVQNIWKTTTGIWTCGEDLLPNFLEKCCLEDTDLDKYFKPKQYGFNYVYGYAIHISKLEVFDKPRELSEFNVKTSPQNYCYIESEE